MLYPGQTFGRLTVLEEDHVDAKSNRFYKCKCSCGKHSIVVVREASLKGGNTKSCGCFRGEVSARMRKIREDNVVCSWCGKAEHYAKGLCHECYERSRRGVDYKIYSFPMNVLLTIGIPMQSITQKTKNRIIKFLDSGAITNKQKKIIYEYFRDQKTYEMIGEELGITRERVRQIFNKGLDVLKNVGTIDYILGLLPYKNRIRELQEQIKSLEKTRDRLLDDLPHNSDEILKNISINSIQGLSRRAYHGLTNNNIKTLYDLAQLPRDGYKKMRSVGVGTWTEIMQKSAEYGVNLG